MSELVVQLLINAVFFLTPRGLVLDLVDETECPIRECLPQEDFSSTGGGLCYTNTGGRQAFSQCTESSRPFCSMCLTVPPCESWCEEEAYSQSPLGSTCHLDRECGGDPFAKCHMGVCRRTLWANQKCDSSVEHAACLYGGQKCVDGYCKALTTNEHCWDGYSDGEDLDCQIGWYCLRGLCVPQLPNKHTCFGMHPNECTRGHKCNLLGTRPQCIREYSLPNGVVSSETKLCQSSHIDPQMWECAVFPPYDNSGGGCSSSNGCAREDGSYGDCRCKRWWSGLDDPGYCELAVPERERPAWLQFWEMRNSRCHHNWPEDRCASEAKAEDLLRMLIAERQATIDPTVVPECAHGLLFVATKGHASPLRRTRETFGFFLLCFFIDVQFP